MISLEKNNLDELITNDITLVDFYAPWCGPCKMIESELQELDDKYNIIRVNTDEHKNITFKYRIMSIPTIIVFKDKIKVKEIVGFHNKEELEELIKED
jgi:thioredoxin 1